ncbi:carbon-nitrogen hydrolase family protein [Vibrio viridaestus]|uniref:Carbon-nitrogen hydrolase family protein n=1 Tax=Vibrio viridaestus TaxID=2487322 RepID=A0A3N9U2X5_9VIBR|nr:carbon-nitrogen hydrolase family protein [Vibrio viridaestus]RQW62346.1 carbon-nitrogen hydrolase family protein [Vibrio viridaestus]
MKIAAIQMNSGSVVEDNIELAESLVNDAVKLGAEIILLPEYFCLMGEKDQDRVEIGEEYLNGPIQDSMSALAKQHKIFLIAGTIPLLSPEKEKVFNSQLLFSPEGECLGRYDKVHLFGFDNGKEAYREADILSAGNAIKTFRIDEIDVRPSVCYDLRFPEFYRQNSGYELITAPAAFTYTTGQAHWELLLRTRAIENQCYVIAAAQTGIHPNGSRTYGHSMIIDPWGKVLAQQEEGNGVVIAEMDISELQKVRQQLPALKNRVFY